MNVVRTNKMEWGPGIERGRFLQRRKDLGGQKLRSGLWELAPGKRSFPFHRHQVQEEAMFVISGTAKVRSEEGDTEVGPGDYVSFPPGGTAHHLYNDGNQPFVYLAMTAVAGFDIVEYPDSGKVACSVGSWPAAKRFVFREKDQVDYFDGEE